MDATNPTPTALAPADQTVGADPVARATALLGGFFGGLAPGESAPGIVPDRPVGTPAPVVAKPETPVVPATPTPSEAKVKLADALRQDREERASRARQADEAKQYKTELDKVKAELESFKTGAFENDPIAYVRGRKLSPEAQSMLGQALLYDLVPEKAPPEFRQKLFERKMTDSQKAQEEQTKADQVKAQADFERQQIQNYADTLAAEAKTSVGTYVESDAFFTKTDTDGTVVVDHDAYAQSLFATANNLANAANAAGQQADLSPANVARVLEEEVATRMKRRDVRVAARIKPAVGNQAGTQNGSGQTVLPGTKQSATESAESTAGLGGGGPRQPAKTEDERIARAAEALWGGR